MEVWQQIIRYQFFYAMAALALGFICIISGIALFFHGITGSTSWIAPIVGRETRISDTAPGTILFLVGVFLVYSTRFCYISDPSDQ